MREGGQARAHWSMAADGAPLHPPCQCQSAKAMTYACRTYVRPSVRTLRTPPMSDVRCPLRGCIWHAVACAHTHTQPCGDYCVHIMRLCVHEVRQGRIREPVGIGAGCTCIRAKQGQEPPVRPRVPSMEYSMILRRAEARRNHWQTGSSGGSLILSPTRMA